MRKGVIYLHRNKINGKCYIGSTIQKPSRRWKKNDTEYRSYSSCTVFYRALKKYTWNSFESFILEEDIEYDSLPEREEYYINKYNSIIPNGYNSVFLTNGRVEYTKDVKEKISKKAKERKGKIGPAWNRIDHKIIDGIECKLCTTCKKWLPLDEYCKYNRTWDGVFYSCKRCANKYRNKYRKKKGKNKKKVENMSERVRLQYEKNPEIKKKISEKKSKPVYRINPVTGERKLYKRGLDAQAEKFYIARIKKAINENKLYKGYKWEYQKNSQYMILPWEKNDQQKMKIWNSILSHKNNKSLKIYARNTEIREITRTVANEFCVNNHLQGKANSLFRYGLFYDDELVAIMTFSKSRYNKEYEYELIRYCCKLGTTVVGGASKLLKHFIKKVNPKNIISYCNLRFSNGNLYKKLGFTEIKTKSGPNYWWVKNEIVLTRIETQKHKLSNLLENFNQDLSERENMINNGYKKVEDRGNLVFVMECFNK